MKDWNIKNITGYTPKTTYYMDFGLAEIFGGKAVRETYETAVEQHKENIEIMTEIYMVLNWKIFEHYETNKILSKLYDELWRECYEFILKNYEKYNYDMEYFYKTTD